MHQVCAKSDCGSSFVITVLQQLFDHLRGLSASKAVLIRLQLLSKQTYYFYLLSTLRVGESINFNHVYIPEHSYISGASLPFPMCDTCLPSADLTWKDMSWSRKSWKFNGHVPGNVRSHARLNFIT